jgi:hypothetical protein
MRFNNWCVSRIRQAPTVATRSHFDHGRVVRRGRESRLLAMSPPSPLEDDEADVGEGRRDAVQDRERRSAKASLDLVAQATRCLAGGRAREVPVSHAVRVLRCRDESQRQARIRRRHTSFIRWTAIEGDRTAKVREQDERRPGLNSESPEVPVLRRAVDLAERSTALKVMVRISSATSNASHALGANVVVVVDVFGAPQSGLRFSGSAQKPVRSRGCRGYYQLCREPFEFPCT